MEAYEFLKIIQKQTTFNDSIKARKKSDKLKYFIQYTAVILFILLFLTSICILLFSSKFPEKIVDTVLYTFVFQILGPIIQVFKFNSVKKK